LALGVWGVPRGTVDVDLNLFLPAGEVDAAVAAFVTLGITVDLEQARAASRRDGMFVTTYGGMRVDVFTASIGFAWEAQRTRVRHAIEGRSAWFLSAEALAVFKLLFFRGKDLVDLERLVAVQERRLDTSYVRRHVVEMMGADDPRVAKWDEIVATHGSG
jgi:hypothetical protein